MAKSKGIAHAEERRELLKDSAGGPVCGGHDLAPGKRSKVVPEIAPQDNVLVEPKLDPATQADHGFPFIDRDEACDVRYRLGEGRGAGDHVTLHASARDEERADAVLAL